MTERKSQDECREYFEKMLVVMSNTIKEIDNSTPYSPNEPEWWLDMMELQRSIFQLQNKYNWNKGE